MKDLTTHQLKPMTISAARRLRAQCPKHDAPATGCRTTWDAKTGQDMARVIFSCGCHGLAPIKAAK